MSTTRTATLDKTRADTTNAELRTCTCGQPLDGCTTGHCPRCGCNCD